MSLGRKMHCHKVHTQPVQDRRLCVAGPEYEEPMFHEEMEQQAFAAQACSTLPIVVSLGVFTMTLASSRQIAALQVHKIKTTAQWNTVTESCARVTCSEHVYFTVVFGQIIQISVFLFTAGQKRISLSLLQAQRFRSHRRHVT